ncbi:MAG: protein translocase subunit SecF [Clostridia bacterium]|nr:protein translocase subunit SecF [Clostridia bacterium]
MLNLQNKQFKIVEKFKIFLAISLVIILAGVVMLFVKGMNVGIDFSGGAKLEIQLSSFAGDSDARDIIDGEVSKFLQESGLKKVGAVQTSPSEGGVTYEYRLSYYHNGDLKTAEQEQEFMAFIQGDLYDDTNNGLCGELQTKLDELFKTNETLVAKGAVLDENAVTAHTVGATASGSLLRNACIALLVAVVIMLIYIVIRFTLSSALASICALVHDVLIMIALTVIFQIPVNSTFIAAIITIVGYSINATIVVFDRIREESKQESNKDKTDAEIANYSIVKTLGRSILTTLTTLVMVLFLAIFSVSTIKEFIIPIIFGLIAGAYSSVFLASSFWTIFRKVGKKSKKKA